MTRRRVVGAGAVVLLVLAWRHSRRPRPPVARLVRRLAAVMLLDWIDDLFSFVPDPSFLGFHPRDFVKSIIRAVWNWIHDNVIAPIVSFAGWVWARFQDFAWWVGNVFSSIWAFETWIVGAVTGAVAAFVNWVVEQAKSFLLAAIHFVGTLLANAIAVVDAAWRAALRFVDAIYRGLIAAVDAAWRLVYSTIVKPVLDFFEFVWSKFIAPVLKVLDLAWDWIMWFATHTIRDIMALIGDFIGAGGSGAIDAIASRMLSEGESMEGVIARYLTP